MNPNNLIKIFCMGIFFILISGFAICFAEVGFDLRPFLETQYGYEDNVLQVSKEDEPQGNSVVNILTGINIKAQFDEKTRGSSRYEAAFQKFPDFNRNNRQDHRLSLLFHQKIRQNLSIMALGNLGMRSQPDAHLNNYYKQGIATQADIRWTSLWSSELGMQFQHKSYPYNSLSNYSSLMLEGKLGRQLGDFSQIRGGYQFRVYSGALDPRTLQLEPGQKMKGLRQVISLWSENVLAARVLMELRYQMELDTATKDLQRPMSFPQTSVQTGEFEGEHTDFGDDDEEMDFNFINHKATMMLAWRPLSLSTIALYSKYSSKFYTDWPVPGTNGQRHDNLILLRAYLKQELHSSISARLQYSLEKNNSNDPTQKYTDNIYSIGLT